MNTHPATDEPPIGALSGRGTQQAWKPFEGRKNAPSVRKRYLDLVVRKCDIHSIRNCLID
jgi:hypothetical protein